VLEDGRELGAPAGYTSFAINPRNFDRHSATTSPDGPIKDHASAKAVEMVLHVPQMQYSFGQRKLGAANAAKDSQKNDFPSSIALKLTFPQGNLVVPGEDLKFTLELLEPEPADTKTEVTLNLESSAHILGDRPLLRGAQPSGTMTQTPFNALSSSNSECLADSNGGYFTKSVRRGEATAVTLNISPETAADSPGAFFTSKVWLTVRIIRSHRASMFVPSIWFFDDYRPIPKGYVQDGQSSESGPWALDSAIRFDSTQSYDHRVELPLAKLKSIGLAYHEALGSTEQPVMASGHVQTREEAEDAGARFAFKLNGRLDIPGDLDLFVGQYVGILWKAHEQNIPVVHTRPQVVDAGGSAVGITEQVVFD